MLPFHARRASGSEAGDYFQVLFEEAAAEQENSPRPSRYLLIQRQFEFPNRGRCHIETEIPERCGHFRVSAARLCRDCLFLRWGGNADRQAEVTFEADDEVYVEIRDILRIMIPSIEIVE